MTSSGAAPAGGGLAGAARPRYLHSVPGSQAAGVSPRYDALRLATRRSDDGPVSVTPAGELDLASAPQLESELLALLESGTPRLTIDLRRLSFMDCAGLSAMRRVEAMGGVLGCEVEVLTAPGPAQRLIELVSALDPV